MAMEGFADLRDARRAERTDVQRGQPREQADAGAAGGDSFDEGRVRSGVRNHADHGAGERAEAAVDGERLRSPLQRQRPGIRSTAAGVDRMGQAEPAEVAARPHDVSSIDWLRRGLPALAALVLFLAALEVLRREMHAVTW